MEKGITTLLPVITMARVSRWQTAWLGSFGDFEDHCLRSGQ